MAIKIKEELNLIKSLDDVLGKMKSICETTENPMENREFLEYVNKFSFLTNIANQYNIPISKYYEIIQSN